MRVQYVDLDGDPGILTYDDQGVARAATIYQNGQMVDIHPAELFFKAKELTEEAFTALIAELERERMEGGDAGSSGGNGGVDPPDRDRIGRSPTDAGR
jgi:hypothetical protein